MPMKALNMVSCLLYDNTDAHDCVWGLQGCKPDAASVKGVLFEAHQLCKL